MRLNDAESFVVFIKTNARPPSLSLCFSLWSSTLQTFFTTRLIKSVFYRKRSRRKWTLQEEDRRTDRMRMNGVERLTRPQPSYEKLQSRFKFNLHFRQRRKNTEKNTTDGKTAPLQSEVWKLVVYLCKSIPVFHNISQWTHSKNSYVFTLCRINLMSPG